MSDGAQTPVEFDRRHYDKQRQRDVRRITLMFFLLTIGTIIALWLVVKGNRDRDRADTRNRNERIAQIQQARLQSCRLTYDGIRLIFQPFLPRHPTGAEKIRVRRFNNRIRYLKRGCAKQIGGEK